MTLDFTLDPAISAGAGALLIAVMNELRARANARAAAEDRAARERLIAGRPTTGTRKEDVAP